MAAPRPVVLLIEDEPQMRRFLRLTLANQDYSVVEAATAREGLGQARARNPDVVLLDLGLPDGDGLGLTTELRRLGRMPIIVISARGREQDKVAALDRGADDYLTKPFGTPELLARLRVALRHAAVPLDDSAGPVFRSAGITVDLGARIVTRHGERLHLSPTEYRLLAALVRHAGRLMTHRQLLTEVWGAAHAAETHYLRVYMGHLRHKLEEEPARPRLLITEPAIGYRLMELPPA